MWECPDFFPLGRKWVLLYSTERKCTGKAGSLIRQRWRFMGKAWDAGFGRFLCAQKSIGREGPEDFVGLGAGNASGSPIQRGGVGGMHVGMSLTNPGNDDAARKAALGRTGLEEVSAEIALRWRAKLVHLKLTAGTQEIFVFAYDPAGRGKRFRLAMVRIQ
jgi:hypothetical protein